MPGVPSPIHGPAGCVTREGSSISSALRAQGKSSQREQIIENGMGSPAKVSSQRDEGALCNQFWFWMFKDSPINKLLYARDIPRYKQMVER